MGIREQLAGEPRGSSIEQWQQYLEPVHWLIRRSISSATSSSVGSGGLRESVAVLVKNCPHLEHTAA
jgi:hypothetical protein